MMAKMVAKVAYDGGQEWLSGAKMVARWPGEGALWLKMTPDGRLQASISGSRAPSEAPGLNLKLQVSISASFFRVSGTPRLHLRLHS